jgi:hypothetical protein
MLAGLVGSAGYLLIKSNMNCDESGLWLIEINDMAWFISS